MPRKTRMYLAGIPAHVVQRGNNRSASFFCPDDFLFYRRCLGEGLRRFGVALHAYVLMTNHVHLLMTPSDASGISRVMQHVGRHYVLYVNRAYRRTGTLWEGRHKASLVHASDFLLTCMRYIEMNPVAAGMVEAPEQYRWSSYRSHAWGETDDLLNEHPLYLQLGASDAERQWAYREWFRSPLQDDDIHHIRQCLAYNYPVGNARFRAEVESALGRKIGHCKIGRPCRETNADAPN
ncbi:MAG: transposase [Gammaproteobacteria bacterium]|nr:transposase [Gammaproteobacteria bacterium]